MATTGTVFAQLKGPVILPPSRSKGHSGGSVSPKQSTVPISVPSRLTSKSSGASKNGAMDSGVVPTAPKKPPTREQLITENEAGAQERIAASKDNERNASLDVVADFLGEVEQFETEYSGLEKNHVQGALDALRGGDDQHKNFRNTAAKLHDIQVRLQNKKIDPESALKQTSGVMDDFRREYARIDDWQKGMAQAGETSVQLARGVAVCAAVGVATVGTGGVAAVVLAGAAGVAGAAAFDAGASAIGDACGGREATASGLHFEGRSFGSIAYRQVSGQEVSKDALDGAIGQALDDAVSGVSVFAGNGANSFAREALRNAGAPMVTRVAGGALADGVVSTTIDVGGALVSGRSHVESDPKLTPEQKQQVLEDFDKQLQQGVPMQFLVNTLAGIPG